MRSAGEDVVTFPTKIDAWLLALVGVALVVTLGSGFAALGTVRSWSEAAALVLIPLGSVALVATLSIPTRYELHADTLVIRSGVLRYRYAYGDITGVVPTRNPLSAPAWSLDRLEVQMARRYALVSPRDKAGFLRELAARAPHLRHADDRLIDTRER